MTRQLQISSPCVGVCEMDPESGLCRGCLRNGAEIAVWRDAQDAERQEILQRIKSRRIAGIPKPRGRRANP